MTALPCQLALFAADVPTYTRADVDRVRWKLSRLAFGDVAVGDIWRVERITDADGVEWWILLRGGWLHRGQWRGGHLCERCCVTMQRQIGIVQARFALALCMRGVTRIGCWREAAGLDGCDVRGL